MRSHHEQTTMAAAQILGYLAPLVGAVSARIVLAVKDRLTRRDR